jgi:hypothetical protein
MNINIDVNITGENGGKESWRVLLNQDQLTNIIKNNGIEAGNKALDSFVEKFVEQFKSRLASVINR